LAIRAPRQANALRLSALLANCLKFWLQLIDLALLLQIKDDDAAGGGSAQPVSVRREDKSVDFITSVQRVQVLRLVQIPEHGDGVDVTGVSDVVSLQSAGRELPDLFTPVSGFLVQNFSRIRASETQCQCIGVGLSHGLVSQALK
jgi:hypothetical protein